MFYRDLSPSIVEAMQDTPVVMLHGARQTGKSTLMRNLAGATSSYFTLDDPAVLSALQQDAAGFFAANKGCLRIDEVQRAPELFLAIKHEVDAMRMARLNANGRFLLSGSANVLLLPKLADSLAGRMQINTLWPLSQGELSAQKGLRNCNIIDALFSSDGQDSNMSIAFTDRDSLIDQMLAGGYPEAVERISEKRRNAWFDAYIQTIIQRDIRDLAQIEGLGQLPLLLITLAHKTSGMLNVADISRTLGIAQTSLKRYLQLLQAVFLITALPAWVHRASHRAQKTPKLFFNDSGLMANLLGLSAQKMRASPGLNGALLETFVHAELQKHIGWAQTACELMHYRTSNGDEVDFILQDRQGRVVGVEVKSSIQVQASDFKGLRHLRELIGPQFHRGIVMHSGERSMSFDPQLASVPIGALWAQRKI